MKGWKLYAPRKQVELASEAYDRWVDQDNDTIAEFHRTSEAILVRFWDQADIAIGSDSVSCFPAPDTSTEALERLRQNAIHPLLTNHEGGLCLHGSAIALSGEAIAFLGHSRTGKTTLAAAFAASGVPFLTEDVIELEEKDGRFFVQPQQPVLRVFSDTANNVLGQRRLASDTDKRDVAAQEGVPFAVEASPLARIYLLDRDEIDEIVIKPADPANALAAMLQHAFVLDIADKARLRGHFERLSGLAIRTACFTLDYPRRFADLPNVLSAIKDHA
ncbi:hypothetical protein [Aurantiacibacter aquimixticola]|uniref:Serine kinase n=1 Tax=Aurantiacibacter aquimixticola TaxID=1958945 RepID=A0A419RUH8_9SPHN|nr:hypothetical protein [Aurantiacibacter aquimixticola]RJY09447.1 hypothetical protein D6201_08835 [Aurantiacibacter aquimixticola]